MYERNCPSCNKKIEHTNKYNRNQSRKKGTLCVQCSKRKYPPEFYENKYRPCPNCGEKIQYSRMGDKVWAETNKTLCKKCMKNDGKFKKGHDNPNTKPVYECWVEKYGKEKADKLDKKRKKKWSKSLSGKGNPMYGKPTPQGSGNGWSGWYKDWFFRSLLELSYMIKIIERYNLNWKPAECKELTIEYVDENNTPRTYRADFLINNKYLVDCKPRNLQKATRNLLKKKSAEKFCDNNNLIFKFSEIPKIKDVKFKSLVENNQVKLTKRYEQKYKKWFASE